MLNRVFPEKLLESHDESYFKEVVEDDEQDDGFPDDEVSVLWFDDGNVDCVR